MKGDPVARLPFWTGAVLCDKSVIVIAVGL
jgi:hypothetical protein